MEQIALENQRRREDREHEMNLLRLLVQNPQVPYPTNPMSYSYPTMTVATPLPSNVLSVPSNSSSYNTGDTETDSIENKTYFFLVALLCHAEAIKTFSKFFVVFWLKHHCGVLLF